jgi:hypothetical protein
MFKYLPLLLALGCCSSLTSSALTDETAAVRKSDPILPLTVTVILASDNVTRLPAADVYVIQSDGATKRVGMTDQFGRIEIRRDLLQSPGAPPLLGIMVCHPVFYCGILREEDIDRRTERTIALAIRVIR